MIWFKHALQPPPHRRSLLYGIPSSDEGPERAERTGSSMTATDPAGGGRLGRTVCTYLNRLTAHVAMGPGLCGGCTSVYSGRESGKVCGSHARSQPPSRPKRGGIGSVILATSAGITACISVMHACMCLYSCASMLGMYAGNVA